MPAVSDDEKLDKQRTSERARGARKKREAHRWVREARAIGLVIVLVSTTALLTQSSPALPGDDISAGGLVGWSLTEGLRGTLGNVGVWLVTLAGIPVGVLFVTQVSYGAISRVVASRL